MNIPAKIILGIFTALLVIFPLLSFAIWFGLIFSIASQGYYGYATPDTIPSSFVWFFPATLLMVCFAFLQVILQGFYIVHNIVNNKGSVVIRAILGLGTFFLPYIAMPIYYFIYILPKTTPKWALNQPTTGTITAEQ
jgi:hypothetical protein